jgi:hypothetical protein
MSALKQLQRANLAKMMAEKPATNDGERWVYEHLRLTIEHPELADVDIESSEIARQIKARIGGTVDFLCDKKTGHLVSGFIVNTAASWAACVELAKEFGFAIENITGKNLGPHTPSAHPLSVLMTHPPDVAGRPS